MIFCVWYPSGGFGHFVNAVLSIYGENFARPTNQLEFSANGNSHSLDLVTPKYQSNSWSGDIEFFPDKNYCVLIDNGIDDENDDFKSTFLNSTVIKVCYSTYSWPIVARTMIEKAMNSSLDQQLPISDWNFDESWVRREKYFLFLRDHHFRNKWQQQSDFDLDVYELLDYDRFYKHLNSIVKVESFDSLWNEWHKANERYIHPVTVARKILSSISCKVPIDLTEITDIWTQAVVYYCIWAEYRVEVPHNDYANWFTNTDEIVTMLKNHGVIV